MRGNKNFRYILLLAGLVALSARGQVSSENYVQTTERISDAQRYKYNGKELDRLNGLNWYDYGARNYDAALGRWHSMDNLQENHPDISSYVYVYNNPLRMSDPDGQDGKDRVIGYTIGVITNVVPFTGGLRDAYSPTDASDYNNSLRQSDEVAGKLGNSLNNWGGKATGYGLAAVSLGGATAMTTAGAAVEVAAPIAVAGGTLATTGIAASLTGNLMMANSNSNKSQGYNRGKKSNVSSGNKNSPHANQKRKEVNKQRYEQLKKEYSELEKSKTKTQDYRKKANALKRQMKRAKERMDFKGENHSRTPKGH